MRFLDEQVEIFDHAVKVRTLDEEAGVFTFFLGKDAGLPVFVQCTRHDFNVRRMQVSFDGLHRIGMHTFGYEHFVTTFVTAGQKHRFGRAGGRVI